MEANTKQNKWFIPCCQDESCKECGGTGKIYPERCPVHYYRDVKTLRYFYENYNHKNILPYSGSLVDQPRVVFKYFEMIDHYVSVYNNIKEQRREENRSISAAIRKGIASGKKSRN